MTGPQQRRSTLAMLTVIILLAAILAWSYAKNATLQAALAQARQKIAALEIERAKAASRPGAPGQFPGRLEPPPPAVPPGSALQDLVAGEEEPAVIEVEPGGATSDEPASAERLRDLPDPSQADDDVLAGNSAFAKLDYDSALAKYSRVEEEAEDFFAARMGIANALFYSHQYEKAAMEFSNVHELQPDSVEALVGLANAYQRLGRNPEQIEAFSKAIQLEPGNWLHYNSRATAYLLNGENQRAIEDFKHAAVLARPHRDNEAIALENIGLVYLNEGDWEKAFDHSNKVRRVSGTQGWNWLVRGIAAAKLERNLDAYVSFDEWFKRRRSTDVYLVKQLLAEDIHEYVDVTARGLARLIDPPFISGDPCVNNYQCRSGACRPGPPDNTSNFCVAEAKLCAAPQSPGYLAGETLRLAEGTYRCYQPDAANARWTPDARLGN